MKRAALPLAAVVLVLLAGCAEREQNTTGVKTDTAPFAGTSKPYVAPGWKPGDRNSWEQALKVRTVQGQNDYAKTP